MRVYVNLTIGWLIAHALATVPLQAQDPNGEAAVRAQYEAAAALYAISPEQGFAALRKAVAAAKELGDVPLKFELSFRLVDIAAELQRFDDARNALYAIMASIESRGIKCEVLRRLVKISLLELLSGAPKESEALTLAKQAFELSYTVEYSEPASISNVYPVPSPQALADDLAAFLDGKEEFSEFRTLLCQTLQWEYSAGDWDALCGINAANAFISPTPDNPATPTIGAFPTAIVSPYASASVSETPRSTPSLTATADVTITAIVSVPPLPSYPAVTVIPVTPVSVTPTRAVTATNSPTKTSTPKAIATYTATAAVTATPRNTATPTARATSTPVSTGTPLASVAPTRPPTETYTAKRPTPSSTPGATLTSSPTMTGFPSPSASSTPKPALTVSTQTPVPSATANRPTAAPTRAPSLTPSTPPNTPTRTYLTPASTPSALMTKTPTNAPTATRFSSPTSTASSTATATMTATATPKPKCTYKLSGPYWDDDYVAQTITDRLFDPRTWGVTPTSKIYVLVRIKPPEGLDLSECLKGLSGVYSAMEETISSGGAPVGVPVEISRAGFIDIGLDDEGFEVYESPISGGWPSLWTSDREVLEALVQSRRAAYLLEHKLDANKPPFVEDMLIFGVGVCDRLWGSDGNGEVLEADHDYVFKRAKAPSNRPAYTIPDLFGRAYGVTFGAFAETDPYKTLRRHVAFDVDYAANPGVLEAFPQSGCGSREECLKKAFQEFLRVQGVNGECAATKTFLYDSELIEAANEEASRSRGSAVNMEGFTGIGASTIVIKPSISFRGKEVEVHEAGHAHFNLWDEAPIPGLTGSAYNCREDGKSYKLYGEHDTKGCVGSGDRYIPSNRSIMNYYPNDTSSFNRIGCIAGAVMLANLNEEEAIQITGSMGCLNPNGECGRAADCGALRDRNSCVKFSCTGSYCDREPDFKLCTKYDSREYGVCMSGSCEIQAGWECNYPVHCPKTEGDAAECFTCSDHQCKTAPGKLSCKNGAGEPGYCENGKCIAL